MKAWLTAQELADARLPGLPATRRGLNKLSIRNHWLHSKSPAGEPLARRRPGMGKAVEYHISLLQAPAREALKAEAVKNGLPVNTITAPTIALPPPEFTEADMLRRDARLAVLMLADAFFATRRSLGQAAADTEFAEQYQTGLIETETWIRQAVPALSRRSLQRWRGQRDSGRWHEVGGTRRGRRKSCTLETAHDGEVATYIGGLLVHQPFLTADHVRDLVEARFGAALMTARGVRPLPSIRTFQLYISVWKKRNERALASITDPDRYKSHTRLAGSNAYGYVRELNQLWEIDASPADVLLTTGRYNIYVVIDVFSRRMMAYVTKTPRTDAVLLLVRRAIMAWGVPETLRTDNGSDFVSHEFVRAMNNLGIRQDITTPFSPEQKGIVERAIGTLQRGLMPLLPGFIGHSVADRKSIEGRKAFAQRLGESDARAFCVDLSPDELQAAMDRWCDDKYAHKAHGGLQSPHGGLQSITPFAKAASWTGAVRAINNERALDLLLAPVAGKDGSRTVTKQGIRLDGSFHFAPELIAGMRVFCRQDPEDMGRLIVFDEKTGNFICEAVCPALAGIDPRAAVRAAREAQAEFIRTETADVRKAAKRIKPRHMVDQVLGQAARKRAGVTEFPTPRQNHTTAQLDQAAAALDQINSRPANDTSPTAVKHGATDNVHTLPETPKQRFARALRLREDIKNGADVAATDAQWLGGYETTPEFRAHAVMLEDFGSKWLEA